jgi:coenzyme F420-reducing hydrogenase beta subunit
MVTDNEGFDFPLIHTSECIDCRKCENVCPMINSADFYNDSIPLVYASWNRDKDTRFNSSSGGIFTALASDIIDRGGIVYGVAYDQDMVVCHIGIEKKEDIKKLQGSKYVQSNIGKIYSDVKLKLNAGMEVLFSGTPCQVAGLKNFIGRMDENLITCDLLCHGVPSPQLFKEYIQFLEQKTNEKIVDYKFRDKRNEWGFNNRVAIFENGNEKILRGQDDTYIYGFANCFSLRNSCYNCKYTRLERVGDVTLGDFWGIGEIEKFDYPTKNGVSLLLVNTAKGQVLLRTIEERIILEKRSLEEAKHNRSKLSHPIKKPHNRSVFYKDFSILSFDELSKKHLVDKGVKGLIKKIIPSLWVYKIRMLFRG